MNQSNFTLAAIAACAAFVFSPQPARGAFSLDDDGSRVTVTEDGQPVFTYQYGRVNPPKGTAPHYWRSNYIHPLYGLDGEVLTQDFPEDHPHHRGVFWTWPVVAVDGRSTSPWELNTSRQLFIEWIDKEATGDFAKLQFLAGWRFDEQWEPFITETITVTVHPAENDHRAIDFVIQLTNVHESEVVIGGSKASGYGGFNVRPDATRDQLTIVTARGKLSKDALNVDSPWADFSSAAQDSGKFAGMAIFQHPDNPGYPHPGWILRHYGFLGHSWPHYERIALAPGEEAVLRYRLLIHRGDAETARLDELYSGYIKQQ